MESRKQPTRWVVFALAAAGGFIPLLDLSIVNVAFAEIATAFPSASRADIAWVIAAYNIVFGALLVVGGRAVSYTHLTLPTTPYV